MRAHVKLALRGGHIVATDQLDAVGLRPQRVAITAGTGLYRSARGQIVYRQTTGTSVFTIITP